MICRIRLINRDNDNNNQNLRWISFGELLEARTEMALERSLMFFFGGLLSFVASTTSAANHDYAPDLQNIPQLSFSAPSSKEYSSLRPGNPTNDHMCNHVTSIPSHLTFITRYRHYQKYTHAYGIPIVSSGYVSDAALKRACYVLRFLLADLYKIRYYLYKNYGRAGIIGSREGVRSIPEHSWLPAWWDQRARGLGGTLRHPISTGAEENLLCWSNDRYRAEDIFLHEFSHGMQEIAITAGAIPGFNSRLQTAYRYAQSRGLWANTYAMSTWKEYFAEGVQSYFHVNNYANPPDGIHNHVNTREKLRTYDPTLYALVKEVFPCGNFIKDRCDKSGADKPLRMNCDGNGGGITVAPTTPGTTQPPSGTTLSPQPPSGTTLSPQPPSGTTEPPTMAPSTAPPPTVAPPTNCVDKNNYCASWAARGECSKNPGYMHVNCAKSCNKCGTTSNCIDSHQHCGSWATAGYCQSHAVWMLENCKKSCNNC